MKRRLFKFIFVDEGSAILLIVIRCASHISGTTLSGKAGLPPLFSWRLRLGCDGLPGKRAGTCAVGLVLDSHVSREYFVSAFII